MPDEYGFFMANIMSYRGVQPSDITGACICSVVPPLIPTFEEVCRNYFAVQPLTVSAGVKTGISIQYDSPRDVGTDRVADAVAALKLYGGPVIVVDFGTATVFDAVSADGKYLGGALWPQASTCLPMPSTRAPRSCAGWNWCLRQRQSARTPSQQCSQG